MVPLSCVNCCHNPLQLGPVGTAFGYCTRYRLVLLHPNLTTCGQLLRKDLLSASAARERARHEHQYRTDRPVLVADPKRDAKDLAYVEKPNGQLPPDAVVEEVDNYGRLDSKVGTMAALHQVPGARAEVAMLSLSRAYFGNCIQHGGKWTAGVHLLFWTLRRLPDEPRLEATDLRGPIAYSLGQTIEIAKWMVLALRIALIGDVGVVARRERDPAGALADLPEAAAKAAPSADSTRLLEWLQKRRRQWSRALPAARYSSLRDSLHRPE